MIAGLRGRLESLGSGWAIIDVGGLGFRVHMPTSTLSTLGTEQLWKTTMNLTTRTLLTVKIGDAAKADHIFHILMGEEVLPRKTFIQSYARSVRNLDV